MNAHPPLAFVSFETPFAPCGGIAAVMDRLPRALARTWPGPVAVITPLHHRTAGGQSLLAGGRLASRGSLAVGPDGISLELLHLEERGVDWYFLAPADPGFFAGRPHPYRVEQVRLLRDALLMGAAVPRALEIIAPGLCWILLLQDWQGACGALALAGSGHRAFLTLHNSYDCPAGDEDLARLGLDPGACPGDTVLQRALPLVEDPVFTVSAQFARDLTGQLLQSRIMAPHLQGLLAGRLLGVDNGLFSDPALPPSLAGGLEAGDYAGLRAWKGRRRREFLAVARRLHGQGWGRVPDRSWREQPWFIMAGRDDPRQKGFDLAALAARRFLQEGGPGRFLFFPIPGDEGLAGLEFLRRLARDFPSRVLVIPFLFKEGFTSALQGADFGLMPSFYEPFGMANEFYLNGTLGIARATGGLCQQIIPLGQRGSGFLFHEGEKLSRDEEQWRALNRAGYARGGAGGDRLQERSGYPLFRAMARELRRRLHLGVELYRRAPGLYARMLGRGIHHLTTSFSWEKAARLYRRHLLGRGGGLT